MSLMDQLTGMVASQVAQNAAQKTGLSQDMAAKMMPLAMSVLMGGLKKNAANPQGAAALANALEKHDGGLLDNLSAFGNDDMMADGQKILGHVFGGDKNTAEQQFAAAMGGVDREQASSILAMAAPAVLGMLGKAKREQGLDASALAGLVNEEGVRARQSAPSELSGFMKLLDQDGDGNLRGETLGFGKKILGGLFGRKK